MAPRRVRRQATEPPRRVTRSSTKAAKRAQEMRTPPRQSAAHRATGRAAKPLAAARQPLPSKAVDKHLIRRLSEAVAVLDKMLAQQAPQPETSGGRASGAAQTEAGGIPAQPCPISFWAAEPGFRFCPDGDPPLRQVGVHHRKQPCEKRLCPENNNSGSSASPGSLLSDIPLGLRASLQPFGQGPMKLWQRTAMEAILKSLEPSTLEVYKEAMVRFWDFNAVQEGGRWPTSEEAVLQYLVSLKHAGVSPDTMTTHLEAISFFSQACGHQNLSASFRARTAIEGWRRMVLLHPDGRRPITYVAEALY